MADFGTYVRLALMFGIAAVVKTILDTVVDPLIAPGCGSNLPTAVDGSMNCTLMGDATTWFLAVVVVGMVFIAFNPVIQGRGL